MAAIFFFPEKGYKNVSVLKPMPCSSYVRFFHRYGVASALESMLSYEGGMLYRMSVTLIYTKVKLKLE